MVPSRRRAVAPHRLTSTRLVCDRFTLDHVAMLGAMDREYAVQRWLFDKTYTPDETLERARRRVKYWEEYGAGDYIVHTKNGACVGFAGFFPAALPDAIAVGYALFPVHWGQGYGTELGTLLVQTAVTLGRREIVATVLPTNLASRRILEKSGFTLAGPSEADPEALLYRYTATERAPV